MLFWNGSFLFDNRLNFYKIKPHPVQNKGTNMKTASKFQLTTADDVVEAMTALGWKLQKKHPWKKNDPATRHTFIFKQLKKSYGQPGELVVFLAVKGLIGNCVSHADKVEIDM